MGAESMFRVALMFFLTTVDITIATTSLVAMTADLGDFEMSSWIVTSYQVGYVGKSHSTPITA